MQKTKSSLIDTTYRRQRDLQSRKEILHTEGKEIFEYFQTSCSTHPCMLQDIPDLPVIHDFSLSRQYYVHPGIPPSSTNSTTYSILQLECIFYMLAGFHRNSTKYQLRHYKLQTFILQRKGDVALSVKCQDDTFFELELIPTIVLSSKGANYKNDIS